MKILFVSPEIAPYAKTGGLADVAKALPEALHSIGHDVRTIMPKYLSIAQQNLAMERMPTFPVQTHHGLHGGVLWQTENDGVPTYLVDNEVFFNREGFYGLGDWNYPDNLERFVFFCKAVLECCKAIDFLPDLIHCNDWQTAALPAILKATYAGYCHIAKIHFFDLFRKLCTQFTISLIRVGSRKTSGRSCPCPAATTPTILNFMARST